eukprot:1939267-Amphidinium_carterae.1
MCCDIRNDETSAVLEKLERASVHTREWQHDLPNVIVFRVAASVEAYLQSRCNIQNGFNNE